MPARGQGLGRTLSCSGQPCSLTEDRAFPRKSLRGGKCCGGDARQRTGQDPLPDPPRFPSQPPPTLSLTALGSALASASGRVQQEVRGQGERVGEGGGRFPQRLLFRSRRGGLPPLLRALFPAQPSPASGAAPPCALRDRHRLPGCGLLGLPLPQGPPALPPLNKQPFTNSLQPPQRVSSCNPHQYLLPLRKSPRTLT